MDSGVLDTGWLSGIIEGAQHIAQRSIYTQTRSSRGFPLADTIVASFFPRLEFYTFPGITLLDQFG